MSSTNTLSQEVSVASNENEQEGHEEGFLVEERPEMRASVEQDIQAKVDLKHPDASPGGLTLEAEERMAARELEIERTHVRFDARQNSDREARTRGVVSEISEERRREIDERAIAKNPLQEKADPRASLTQEELAVVNQEAHRLAGKLEEWGRAALSRRLATQVYAGKDISDAVLSVFEQVRISGQYVPIGALEQVNESEVNIEGIITQLWESDSPAIQQVGLIEDESGRTKFTSWARSEQPWMEEGERVRIQKAATSWYQGRISVALTGWSTVDFPERGEWW
jgi:hypothetical protein